MKRSRIGHPKHFVCAIFSILLLVCAVEVGMRIYAVTHVSSPTPTADSLVQRSWTTYYELQPLQKIDVVVDGTQESIEIAINSLGIRNPELAVPKPDGVYRVLCLGDERVLAATTPADQTFCRQLAEELSQRTQSTVEVVNAGVPGFCPLLSTLQFRQRLFQLEPDLILLHVDLSDVADDAVCRRYTQTDWQLGPLSCTHPGLVELQTSPLRQFCGEFRVLNWCMQSLGRACISDSNSPLDPEFAYLWLEQDPSEWESAIARALQPVETLQEMTRHQGTRLIVAPFPSAWQYLRYPAPARTTEEGQARVLKPFALIRQLLGSRQVPVWDVSQEFLANRTPQDALDYYELPGIRFSRAGHAAYADRLAQYIERILPYPERRRVRAASRD